MGYRSEVYLRIAEPLVEVVDAARKLDDNLDKMLSDGEAERTDKVKTDFYWEHTKWYDSYPEVQAVESLLDMLQDDDYGFIRLGEEQGDIEQKGYPSDYDMYTNTSVDWQVSMKKSSFIGRTVKYKFGDKVGVVVDGYKVDNKDSLYTDVFKVLYSDKSVEVLIFHETSFQYEPWQILDQISY